MIIPRKKLFTFAPLTRIGFTPALPLIGIAAVEAVVPWFCNLSFNSSIFLYSCSLLNFSVIFVA